MPPSRCRGSLTADRRRLGQKRVRISAPKPLGPLLHPLVPVQPTRQDEARIQQARIESPTIGGNGMNGAESLVRTLVGGGVDVCFANPGTSEMHFVAALDRVEGMR